MGGSIRIPCAFNGLYGFKPPYARNASPGTDGLLVHASAGPMARNFKDLLLLQNVMTGPAPGCATTVRPKLDLPMSYPSIKGWKIALSMTQGWAEIAADVSAS